MQLTPLYEALIYIEDKGTVSLPDLEFLTKPVLRGILGKMEAMRLIEKINSEDLKISPKGQNLLNQYLDNLHKGTIHWDGKWRIVSFSVPETKRPLRDRYRREIESLGLKMILTGLWLTPMPSKTYLEDIAKRLGIYQNVFICETSEISTGITQEELLLIWDFEKSKNEIYHFLEEADIFLKTKHKTSFEIKKMIFKYALILENQPKVPIELFPKDWPQFRANLAYRKIRRLLTNR